MGKSIRFSLALAFSILLSACGGSNKVQYDIKIPVTDPAKLSAEARAIYDALESGQGIAFDDITAVLGKSHEAFYGNGAGRTGEVLALIDEAKASAPDADFHKRKVQYEEWLTKKKGAAAVYNSESTTVFHFLLDNKMQCYSGTVLNQLVNRKSAAAEKYRGENWVAIYESGHILSGYLKQIDGKWNLFGIETTAEGLALVEYGPVDAITTELRIVDAEYWALVELFKFHLSSQVETGNQILEYTAQKYGLKAPTKLQAVVEITKINQSPFSFGTSDVTPGDKPRGKFDRRSRGNMTGSNPNPNSGSYRETNYGNDKTALVGRIQELVNAKSSYHLNMNRTGVFCTESSRVSHYGGLQICNEAGARVSELQGYENGPYLLQQLSIEALNELLGALERLEPGYF